MSLIYNLNMGLQTLFNTATSDPMTTLRDSVSSLWDTEAPLGTPYPILTFENVDTVNNPSFCTDIELAPIDFYVYSESKQTTLELAYLVRQAFTEDMELSGGYTILRNLYDSTYTQYDSSNQSFVSVVSINYNVQSPITPWNVSPYDPSILQDISNTVTTLSSSWEAGRVYPINFGFEYPSNNTSPGVDIIETMLINQEITLSDGVAQCTTAGSTVSTIFNVLHNNTLIGTITFNVGSVFGIVDITQTTIPSGDYVKVVQPANPDDDLYGVQINLRGIVV